MRARYGPDLAEQLFAQLEAKALDEAAAARTKQPTDLEPATRLEVRDGNRITWLAPADIIWAEAAPGRGASFFFTLEGGA